MHVSRQKESNRETTLFFMTSAFQPTAIGQANEVGSRIELFYKANTSIV
jgi:hypothetical protein